MKENVFRILKGKIWIFLILLISVNGIFAEEINLFTDIVNDVQKPNRFDDKYSNLVNYSNNFLSLIDEIDYKGDLFRSDCERLNNFLENTIGEQKAKKIVKEYFDAYYSYLPYMKYIQNYRSVKSWRLNSSIEQLCYHFNFFDIRNNRKKWSFLRKPFYIFQIKEYYGGTFPYTNNFINKTNYTKSMKIRILGIGNKKTDYIYTGKQTLWDEKKFSSFGLARDNLFLAPLDFTPDPIRNKEEEKYYFRSYTSTMLKIKCRSIKDIPLIVSNLKVFSTFTEIYPFLEEYLGEINYRERNEMPLEKIKNIYKDILLELEDYSDKN